MKRKSINYIVMVLAMIMLNACTDEFLTQVNPNEVSTDSFWNTLDDCDAGLIAVYNEFKNQSIMAMSDEYNRSDLTYPGYGRPTTTNEYYLQNFTNASKTPNSKWEALYRGIFRANQVIAGLEGIKEKYTEKEDVQRWATIMAQTKFFRGLFYFYLYTGFNKGSVIIFDFVPTVESDFFQPLSSPEDVRAFFLKDLEYAYEAGNLPGSWSDDYDAGRITRGAVAALLGKHYLYEGDYTTAEVFFKDVIDNYGYALAQVNENFTTVGELNSESILEIVYSNGHKLEEGVYSKAGTHSTLNLGISPKGGWRGIIPSSWLIMAYKNDTIDSTDVRNQAFGGGVRKYSWRTSFSIALADDDLFYYRKLPVHSAPFNNLETAYFRKYTNWDLYENENDAVPSQRSGINYRVIRLADVYLMYAECLLKGGSDASGVQEALTYINRVRYRSALRLIGKAADGEYSASMHDERDYTAEDVMDHLMYIERPLELSIEGNAIRTIDMRRWGITKQRFEDLSKLVYHTSTLDYIDEKGKAQKKWNSLLSEGSHPEGNPKYTLTDYSQAANNFNEELHGYWPIPSSESIANPLVNKND